MKNRSFEEAYSRLQEIVTALSSDEVALDASMQLFEEAHSLVKECSGLLTQAEQKIEKLLDVENGEAITEPYTPPESRLLDSAT